MQLVAALFLYRFSINNATFPKQHDFVLQAECANNNPYTTDISSKSLGGTVSLSFQNSSGAIPISNLQTPIDAFVPRTLDNSLLTPIFNVTQTFSKPLVVYQFSVLITN